MAEPETHPSYATERIQYLTPDLLEADLAPHPLAQFEQWYGQARQAGVLEPNAMVLATVGADGVPSVRTVLLKEADPRGFVFFTNYGSRKAGQIGSGAPVALCFTWIPQHRQVCVRGYAERVPRAETEAYFPRRPWDSRIGAWASEQSRPLDERGSLERRWAELARRWPDHGRPDDVPVPEHWGGFVVRPFEIEFWQGRPSRLHDRLVYLPTDPPSGTPVPGDTAPGATPVDGSTAAGKAVNGTAADRPFSDGTGPWTPALDDPAGWRILRRQP